MLTNDVICFDISILGNMVHLINLFPKTLELSLFLNLPLGSWIKNLIRSTQVPSKSSYLLRFSHSSFLSLIFVLFLQFVPLSKLLLHFISSHFGQVLLFFSIVVNWLNSHSKC